MIYIENKMKVSIESEGEYDDDDEDEEVDENEYESEQEMNSKPKNRFDRKLNYHFLRITPKSNQYKKGKSVLVTIGRKQIRGWVHDISEKKVLIRYKKENKSQNKTTMKTVEKWFNKNSKKIELYSRC